MAAMDDLQQVKPFDATKRPDWLMRQARAHLRHWDLVCGVLICLSVCCAIVEADASTEEQNTVMWAMVANRVVLGVYNVEMAVKLYDAGKRFWLDGWNIADFVVIVVDDLFCAVGIVGGGMPSVCSLRAFRLAKLALSAPISNVVPEMVPLVHGMACAFKPVICGTILVASFLVMWSILAVRLLHEANLNAYQNGLYADCERCPRAFSSVWNAFLTLVQTIVLGDSWGTVVIPVIEESPATLAVFVAVLVSVSMALLNLILVVLDRMPWVAKEVERVVASEVGPGPASPPSSAKVDGTARKGAHKELLTDASAASRFAALMHDLAAQHEMEVAALRRALEEARSEHGRPRYDLGGSSGTTEEVMSRAGQPLNGMANDPAFASRHHADNQANAKTDLMMSTDPVVPVPIEGGSQRGQQASKTIEPPDTAEMSSIYRVQQDQVEDPHAGLQDVAVMQEAVALPLAESVPNLPSKFVMGREPNGSRAEEQPPEEPEPIAPEHVVSAGTADGVLPQTLEREPSAPNSSASNQSPIEVSSQPGYLEDHVGWERNVTSSITFSRVLSEVALPPGNLMELAISVLQPKFDMIIGCFIVGNTLVMALELEYNGQKFYKREIESCAEDCGRIKVAEDFFFVMEHFFTAVFAIELVLQLKMYGRRYLLSVSNILDAVIVVVSMVDSWLLSPMGDDSMGNVAILRLVRLLRLAKVLRVVRVMKAFQSLRVLVGAVANSVGALGWSMTLLFVLELIGAIFMAQVLKPFMEDPRTDPDLREFIYLHFGTWTNSMFTIFEVTMAPGGFARYRRLYEEVHPLFGIFFVVYVCVVTFAVVRVITALFLKATLAASATDERATQEERAKEQSNYIFSLRDKVELTCGVMTPASLRHVIKLKDFRDWLKDAGVEQTAVRRLFMTLQNHKGTVEFDEWAQALVHLTNSQQQHVDTVLNFYETRSIFQRMSRLEALIVNCAGAEGTIKDSVKDLYSRSSTRTRAQSAYQRSVTYLPGRERDSSSASQFIGEEALGSVLAVAAD